MSSGEQNTPPPEVQQRIRDLSVDLKGGRIAKAVWNRLLTVDDRAELGGNLERAYELHKTGIGLWQKARGVSVVRAIIDVAHGLGLLDEATQAWLLRETGEADFEANAPQDRPEWDAATGELRFGNRLARKVRLMTTTKYHLILEEFDAQGWPRSIDTPAGWQQQETHDYIRTLNEGLEHIRFHVTSGATRIHWEVSTSQ